MFSNCKDNKMSFLAALPLIGEVAAEVGITTTEITGSSTLGTAAQGGVLAEAGKVVNDASKSAVDLVFGEGSYDSVKNYVEDNYTKLKNEAALVSNLNQTGDQNAFIKKYTEEKRKEQAAKEKQLSDKTNKAPLSEGTSKFIKDFSGLASTGNYDLHNEIEHTNFLQSALDTMARINPLYALISSKISNRLTDFVIPNNPEYKRVSSIYTGAGLENVKLNGSFFSLTDETGAQQVWFKNYNNYAVVSPIFGIWCGINSSNNSLPLTGIIDGKEHQSYLDKISYAHDVGYHDLGSFNEFSDYQIISRAKYGIDNNLYVFPGEEVIAKTAIAYFSTLGSMMRMFFGPGKNELKTPLITEIHNEVYPDDEPISPELINVIQETVTQEVKNNAVGNMATNSLALQYALQNLEVQLD